ncbi:MAG: hypothetical protein ACOY3X_03020 [Pseudomonadota bacterium]
MSTPRKPTGGVIDLAEVRRRIEAEQEDVVAPIRAAFMEELGAMFDDYMDEIRAATYGDEEKVLEELIATSSAMLALAAEEHSSDLDEQLDFIDTVSEIAAELVVEESPEETTPE